MELFSSSSSLALIGWSAGLRFGLSLVTALVMDSGGLSSMAVRALSVEGARAFTGNTMAEPVSLAVWEVEIMSGALTFAWKLFCPAMSSAESLQEDLLMTGVLNTFSRENTITSGSGGMSLS